MSCSSCGKSPSCYSCPCGGVSYCGSICQKADWKRHKLNCPPYKIQEIPGKGKGMVATRNIKPGTVILEEAPLLSYGTLDGLLQTRQLLELSQSLPDDQKQKVLSLHDPGENVEHQKRIRRIQYVQQTVMMEEGKVFGVNSLKFVRIAFANMIEVSNETHAIGGALYEKISRINHSCAPNCVWVRKRDNVYIKEVRAVKIIEKGEEIVASYISDKIMRLKAERKEELKNWNFDCRCKVCSLEGEELKKNEELRSEIVKKYEICDKIRPDFTNISAPYAKVEEHLSASKVVLELMLKIEDESIPEMPELFNNLFSSSFMLTKLAKLRGLQMNNLEEQTNEYKKQAFELAKRFGGNRMYFYEKRLNWLSKQFPF